MTEPDPDVLARGGILLDVRGPVATVTLDRPEVRNAQDPSMWEALAVVGRSLGDEVRVVLVRGSGRSFSAGLDRRMLSPDPDAGQGSLLALLSLGDREMADRIGVYQQGFTWLRDPRFVSVAVVQGHAIGAGFQLALACDLMVAADDVQLSMKEPALGLVPDLTGTKPLVERVGYARALELVASARTVEAEEARTLGLAELVVPRDDLDGATEGLVQALLAPVAGAVRGTKRILQQARGNDLEAQARLEREVQVTRMRDLAAALGR